MTPEQLLLGSDDPEVVASALQRVEGPTIARLERFVRPAVHGKRPAIRGYVRGWLQLQHNLLELAGRERSGSVTRDEEGCLSITGGDTAEVIKQGAFMAPFSPWVVSFGPGTGVALYLLSEIRRALVDAHPLIPEGTLTFAFADIDRTGFARFVREVHNRLDAVEPLQMIADVFVLSDTDLGRLFDVSRQAVAQWSDDGIPSARMSRVHTVQRICDILRREIQPDRIGAVVREAAAAYGDRSILEAIGAGDEEHVLVRLEETFDWAGTT